ncbi:MAG: hypothetical protein JW779_10480 [Candidatus Thorarchaeota archaeon]|nr:hypothetical protein [Candidatus Thorarchaeota archaeon]
MKRGQSYHMGVSREILIMGADLNRPRMRVEYERVSQFCKGFSFKKKTLAGKEVLDRVEGYFTIEGRRFGLRIMIPKNYPYEIPRVFPLGWRPQGAPHQYCGGDLCLMRPEQWNEIYSLAFVIKKAQYWVHKYLKWRMTGKWPGRSQD